MSPLWIGFPLIAFCVCIWFSIFWFTGREKISRNRIRKAINREIIKGNKFASKLKRNRCTDVEDEELIMAALEGNENAMKTLVPIDKHGID